MPIQSRYNPGFAPEAVQRYWSSNWWTGVVARAGLRTLLLLLAVAVAALYGIDLAHSSMKLESAQPSWIYAEVVSALAALTCSFHCIVNVSRILSAPLDFAMCVLWAALLGVFGNVYYHPESQPEVYDYTQSVRRMKAAFWVDLVNFSLWLFVFAQNVAWSCQVRRITRLNNSSIEHGVGAEQGRCALDERRSLGDGGSEYEWRDSNLEKGGKNDEAAEVV